MDVESVNRLRRVVVHLGRQFNATATAAELTPSQASALGSIARNGSIRIAELVKLENLHPSVASRIVAKLEAAGLIRRTTDPTDQRSAWVHVTPAGQRVQQGIADSRSAIVSRAAAHLSPQEATAIQRALPALEALIDRLERANG